MSPQIGHSPQEQPNCSRRIKAHISTLRPAVPLIKEGWVVLYHQKLYFRRNKRPRLSNGLGSDPGEKKTLLEAGLY